MALLAALTFLLGIAQFALPSHAHSGGFAWSFKNNTVSSIRECQSLPIIVTSRTGGPAGQPPYYLIAFEVDGVPTTSMIETGTGGLNWLVNHQAGKQLMLSMVDSAGDHGGTHPNIFTVTYGSSRSCFLPPRPSNFSLLANVTGQLPTCHQLGIRVKGGVQPYTVTVASLDASIVTNVTMGENDDTYSYINRAQPGSQLLVAVSDAAASWAQGSTLVRTIGSTDTSCGGLTSIASLSGNVTRTPTAMSSLTSKLVTTKSAQGHTIPSIHKVIIGICVTLGVLIIISGLVLLLLCLRERGRHSMWSERSIAYLAGQENSGPMASFSVLGYPKQVHSPRLTVAIPSSPLASAGLYLNSEQQSSAVPVPVTRSEPPTSSPVLSPPSTGAIYAKVIEAYRPFTRSANMHDALTNQLSTSSMPESSLVPPNFIFQHKDADTIRELPPPYVDRPTIRLSLLTPPPEH